MSMCVMRPDFVYDFKTPVVWAQFKESVWPRWVMSPTLVPSTGPLDCSTVFSMWAEVQRSGNVTWLLWFFALLCWSNTECDCVENQKALKASFESKKKTSPLTGVKLVKTVHYSQYFDKFWQNKSLKQKHFVFVQHIWFMSVSFLF